MSKPSRALKLFVWEGVLTDWTSGVCFALARSAKEAVALVVKSGLNVGRTAGIEIDGTKPNVYRGRAGFHVWGGG